MKDELITRMMKYLELCTVDELLLMISALQEVVKDRE